MARIVGMQVMLVIGGCAAAPAHRVVVEPPAGAPVALDGPTASDASTGSPATADAGRTADPCAVEAAGVPGDPCAAEPASLPGNPCTAAPASAAGWRYATLRDVGEVSSGFDDSSIAAAGDILRSSPDRVRTTRLDGVETTCSRGACGSMCWNHRLRWIDFAWPVVDGALAGRVVRRELRNIHAALTGCQRHAPYDAATVAVTLQIDRAATVTPTVVGAPVAVDACLADVLRDARFPRAAGPTSVRWRLVLHPEPAPDPMPVP